MSVKRTIVTNLLKKEEAFRVMALGEAMNTPILLIGDPGVAKTAAVMDFAKARLGTIASDDLFLLETDEGTRSNAVKGNIDLEALTTANQYKVDSPITKASVVVINEIDKASASLRNSLLGIMNERILFNGKEKVDCQWVNFIATCNEIPDDEINSPFWDRFLITFTVTRLTQSAIMSYFAKGGKTHSGSQKINMPEEDDINAITLNPDKIKKTLDVIYSKLSDRAITFLPQLVKNVMIIWNLTEDKAFVKATDLLVDKDTGRALGKTLISKEMRELDDAIDGISQCVDNESYQEQYDKIEKAYGVAKDAGQLQPSDEEAIKAKISSEEEKLPFLADDEVDENVWEN